MKITGLSTVVVGAEMRNWVFVKVETDEGLVGWGESTVEWKTRAVVACVEDFRSLLIGEDPRRVEHLFQMMVRQHFFRPGMVEGSAISGIEQACWDILGKSLGVPVWQLLGGKMRPSIRAYANGWYRGPRDPSFFAEAALRVVEMGYTALKFDPFG